MSDPDKPMRLSEAITPVGTCQSMCAEYERVQRAVQRDVWDEEKVGGLGRHYIGDTDLILANSIPI